MCSAAVVFILVWDLKALLSSVLTGGRWKPHRGRGPVTVRSWRMSRRQGGWNKELSSRQRKQDLWRTRRPQSNSLVCLEWKEHRRKWWFMRMKKKERWMNENIGSLCHLLLVTIYPLRKGGIVDNGMYSHHGEHIGIGNIHKKYAVYHYFT